MTLVYAIESTFLHQRFRGNLMFKLQGRRRAGDQGTRHAGFKVTATALPSMAGLGSKAFCVTFLSYTQRGQLLNGDGLIYLSKERRYPELGIQLCALVTLLRVLSRLVAATGMASVPLLMICQASIIFRGYHQLWKMWLRLGSTSDSETILLSLNRPPFSFS